MDVPVIFITQMKTLRLRKDKSYAPNHIVSKWQSSSEYSDPPDSRSFFSLTYTVLLLIVSQR